MQVGHQVAQKFSTSTLPPKERGVTVLPWSVATEKPGALPPSFADVSRRLKKMIPAKATPKMPRRARKLLLIVTGVLIPLNYIGAQDTQFPAQGSQIPGPAEGAAARAAWLADLTRWRHERLIRIGYHDEEYGGRSSPGRIELRGAANDGRRALLVRSGRASTRWTAIWTISKSATAASTAFCSGRSIRTSASTTATRAI